MDPEAFTASQAKNEFARVLDAAISKGAVLITKHDAPKAVLVSIEEFDELTRARREVLAPLRMELDDMVREMQMPTQRRATRSLFEAEPEELGRAAVAIARKASRKARG